MGDTKEHGLRPYVWLLSETERAAVIRHRDTDPRPYLREMCAALVKVADGMAIRQVALTGLGRRRKPETVSRWLAKYTTGGIAALLHQPRGHRGFSPRPGRGAG